MPVRMKGKSRSRNLVQLLCLRHRTAPREIEESTSPSLIVATSKRHFLLELPRCVYTWYMHVACELLTKTNLLVHPPFVYTLQYFFY